MALTADEKEAIMSARGVAPAVSAEGKVRRYHVDFVGGKSCTALDMHGCDENQMRRDITEIFTAKAITCITRLS